MYFLNYSSYCGDFCFQLPIFDPTEFIYNTFKHFHTLGVQNFGTRPPKWVSKWSKSPKMVYFLNYSSYRGAFCAQLPIFDPAEFIDKTLKYFHILGVQNLGTWAPKWVPKWSKSPKMVYFLNYSSYCGVVFSI